MYRVSSRLYPCYSRTSRSKHSSPARGAGMIALGLRVVRRLGDRSVLRREAERGTALSVQTGRHMPSV